MKPNATPRTFYSLFAHHYSLFCSYYLKKVKAKRQFRCKNRFRVEHAQKKKMIDMHFPFRGQSPAKTSLVVSKISTRELSKNKIKEEEEKE
jgi:hypothetical protein